jgi:hypothetical protein
LILGPTLFSQKIKEKQAKLNNHLLWVGEVIVDLLVKDVEDHIEEIPAWRCNKILISYQSSES